MAKGGFRLSVARARSKLSAVQRIEAASFKPILQDFMRSALTEAARKTPVRAYDVIKRNQEIQYEHRVNYIPSYHEQQSPSLRIRNDIHWLWSDGRWYQANKWKLPSRQYAQYQALLQEHERRKKTSRNKFIKGRAQARYLYRKSWTQCANSLGISIPVSPRAVVDSYSRHNPPKEPPRGYGQWRGGKTVLSASVSNPFLNQPSRYKQWTASDILDPAMARYEPKFRRDFQRALKWRMKQAMRA